jgi:hypothetical protein
LQRGAVELGIHDQRAIPVLARRAALVKQHVGVGNDLQRGGLRGRQRAGRIDDCMRGVMRQRQPLLVDLVGHGRQRCGQLVLKPGQRQRALKRQ